MEFRLLGPLEVEDDGRPLTLSGAKQRALLAVLLLNANEVVARDRLIEELWGDRPPPTAPHSLEVYVSRLRKILHANGDEQWLLTRAGGYVLQLEREQLDVTRFERLVAEGRRSFAAADYERAAQQLADGLALWRGPALSDLAYESFASAEIDRLEEERMAAIEDRIEAELALGRHSALVGELEQLSGRHPLRERLHGQLMLALYGSGRQAEALAVYRETRRHLMDELGIEPSPDLQRLEQAILRQDPALEPSPSKPDQTSTEKAPPRRSLTLGRWRPVAIAVVIGGVLVAAIAGTIVLFNRSSEPSLSAVGANAVGVVDPKTGAITGETLLDGSPTHVVSGAGSIWIVTPNRQRVTRIDSKTDQIVQTIEVGSGPSGIAYAGRAIWVVNSLDGTVSRIDPGTNSIVENKRVGNVPIAIAAGFGSVWVTSAGDRRVVRLDADTGHQLASIKTGDVGRGIAVGSGAVWVSDDERGRVSRIDPETNGVTQPSIPVGSGATALAYIAGSVWVANEFAGTVARIDPHRNAVRRTIPIDGTPGDLTAAADGALWVSDANGGRIVRVDPRRNKVVGSIETGNRPQSLTFAGGRLWLAVQPAAAQHRGGTLKVVSVGRTFDSLDPAVGYDGPAVNVLAMLYDGLTAYQRVGNADGTKLVPDLATSLPAPSDDGRTYVFQLRRGIRYSNGQLVRPRDFRYGLERLFKMRRSRQTGLSFYGAIRGAAHCAQHPSSCDLTSGVVTDEHANTVTFHLVKLDPEFLQKLTFAFAAPVPTGTPERVTVVPATGPYYIWSYKIRRRLKLARNPYFRKWSEAAAPDGYPDRISWTLLRDDAASARKEVRAIERGQADVAFDAVPRGLLHEVRTQHATEVHAQPLWGVTYLFLNSRRPPFNDVRARQAANYAADRAAAVPAAAQLLGAEPTCQILPPNFPGFSRYCPYTVRPSRSGFWTGPDLLRARRMVAASGTKGAPLTVWIPTNQNSEARIAAGLLRSIGYRPHLVHVDPRAWCCSRRGPGNPRTQVQASVGSWFADYTAASNYMDFFSCNGFVHFCDRSIGRRIRHALSVQAVDPEAANGLWTGIDRALVDRAVAVPLITHQTVNLVSRRVGNYESVPYPYGVLLDQLWVK